MVMELIHCARRKADAAKAAEVARKFLLLSHARHVLVVLAPLAGAAVVAATDEDGCGCGGGGFFFGGLVEIRHCGLNFFRLTLMARRIEWTG